MQADRPPAQPDAGTPMLIGAAEASRMLGVSPRTLWGLSAAGGIPTIRIGSRVLYRVEAIRQWAIRRERGGTR